jgi:uncharacterized membrane protein YphA (DoxX/SURF4 family)
VVCVAKCVCFVLGFVVWWCCFGLLFFLYGIRVLLLLFENPNGSYSNSDLTQLKVCMCVLYILTPSVP